VGTLAEAPKRALWASLLDPCHCGLAALATQPFHPEANRYMCRSYHTGRDHPACDAVGCWGATEQLWNAFHNCSVAPQHPNRSSQLFWPLRLRQRQPRRRSGLGQNCILRFDPKGFTASFEGTRQWAKYSSQEVTKNRPEKS